MTKSVQKPFLYSQFSFFKVHSPLTHTACFIEKALLIEWGTLEQPHSHKQVTMPDEK